MSDQETAKQALAAIEDYCALHKIYLGSVKARDVIRDHIMGVISAEREQRGGAIAVRYDKYLVFIHPETPVHVWDGTKMERIDYADMSLWDFIEREKLWVSSQREN